jgi:hypothetical protein
LGPRVKHSCDLVIIGAGPYGLSLAAHLGARGVDYRIFGDPMGTWAHHMPMTMTLKSEGFASNLSGPASDSTLAAWAAKNGVAYDDREKPITLDNFLSYADSFRRRFVSNVENRRVVSLDRGNDGYELALDDGERVQTQNVVLAVGVSWFQNTPDVLASLPPELLSHSFDHRDCSGFKGREVGIVGTGSSAIDLAHLLNVQGALPHIIGRAPRIEYNIVPDPDRQSLSYRLQNPPSPIGRGWRSYFCSQAPLAFYRLPRQLKDRAIRSHMHAAGGWFMREQIEGRIAKSLGYSVKKAVDRGGRPELTLVDAGGWEDVRSFDHVISATGYRADLSRVPFLAPGLLSGIDLVDSAPFVSDNFETSLSGLYAIGLSAMTMFGPLMRFMVGTEFVAPRLAAHLERKLQSNTVRRAA